MKAIKYFLSPSILRTTALLLSLIAGGSNMATAATDKPWTNIGRAATSDEIKAWDIDVRADFTGLPAGSGSVSDGNDIWEEKCESCHGVFAESTHVFTPLVGGTTDEDIKTGRVANLNSGTYPHRSTLMKLSKISTLWDYINRAMPWNAPKSLSPDEVYAVTAFMLHLGGIVDEDFVFSNENIAQVQEMLPNRNGMKKFDGMWHVNGTPDVQGDNCMKDCPVETERSSLPDYARDAHGNLAEQSRIIGATRGAVTIRPKTTTLAQTQQIARQITVPGAASATDGQAEADTKPEAKSEAKADPDADAQAKAMAQKFNCLACHGIDTKLVGPSFVEIAKRYAKQNGAEALLVGRVQQGASGTWGPVPMPPNAAVNDVDGKAMVSWILRMAK